MGMQTGRGKIININFGENVEKEEIDTYRDTKNYINDLFYNKKDYDKCIEETNNILIVMAEDGYKNKRDLNYCYITLSMCYNQINKKQNAIRYARLSIQYVPSTQEYIRIIWNMARCYEIANKKKAIKYYNKCINMCKSIINNKYDLIINMQLIALKQNKYILENNTDEIINCFIDIKRIYDNSIDNKEFKNICYFYNSICNIVCVTYISEHNFREAIRHVIQITNKDIRKSLFKQIRNKMLQQHKVVAFI